MSVKHMIHTIGVPGLDGNGFTAPEAAAVRSDVTTAMNDAVEANLFARVADNLYYNVMSPAKGPVAAGDGVTDDWATIQHRLSNLPTAPDSARGGKVVLEPGHTYMISQTLNVTMVNTDLDGIVGGTLTTMGATTIKAMPGFTGPLIKVNIPSGSKGAWLRNLRLDGNNEPGVTAGVEFADGTVSVANMFDVAITNVDIGILTGNNCQSLFWERVLAAYGTRVGVQIGSNNRHIMMRDSRIGGWEWGAILGTNDTISANRTQTPIFDGCEIYAMSKGGTVTPNGAALVRNTDNARFTNCYIEVDAASPTPINALVQLGTAGSVAYTPVLIGNRYGANAKAQYGVDIVNAVDPTVDGSGNDRNMLPGGLVKWSQSIRNGNVTGGAGNSAHRRMSTLDIETDSGFNAWAVYEPGDAQPRIYARSSFVGFAFGGGSAAPDTMLLRGLSNQLTMGAGDAFRTGNFTALPAVSAAWRGYIIRVEGGAGVADKLYICRKNAAEGYEWKEVSLV